MQIGDIIASKGLNIRGTQVKCSRQEATSIIKAKMHREPDGISRPQKPKLNKDLQDDSSPAKPKPMSFSEYMSRYPGVHKLGYHGNFDRIITKPGI